MTTAHATDMEPLSELLAVGYPIAKALATVEVRGIYGDDLTALRELRNARDAAANGLVLVARALNDQGHSWAEIGAELGITRQAAFQAFAERKPTVDESDPFEGLF